MHVGEGLEVMGVLTSFQVPSGESGEKSPELYPTMLLQDSVYFSICEMDVLTVA